MPTIIKRSGREEEFNIEKIKNTVAAASDELRQPLTLSDINNLAMDVRKKVQDMERVTSQELLDILIGAMRQEGYAELAQAYLNSGSDA